MAFSYGFYNSYNHDRKYDAVQMSMIFDGIITDGVYATVGEAFVVKHNDDPSTVTIGSGRAWFAHTWNYNDSDLPVVGEISELILDRIDAVVIDVNSHVDYRHNEIKWVKGVPSSNPVAPTMEHTLEHNQYPLAYIYRKANVDEIKQEDITNTVGTEECPFVTGILKTISIDNLLLQWKDQWAQFVIEYEKTAVEWADDQKKDFNEFYTEFKKQMGEFETASGKEFNDWFQRLQDILDEDTAGHLQNEIDEITATEFNRFYGLIASVTDIDDRTDSIKTVTSEAESITRFTKNEGVDIITTTLVMNSGPYDYVKTTRISDGEYGAHIETTHLKRPK